MQPNLTVPPLPTPRARALTLLAHGSSTIAELSAVVEADRGLEAAVLHAARSAASSSRSRIQTPEDAIVRIGLGPARRILTGAVLRDTFSNVRWTGLDLDALWEHLVATALLAEVGNASPLQRGAAFTAGLLHDIGRLAMATSDPERYARVASRVREGERPDEAEFELFGTQHTAFGYRVGSAWKLGPEILSAVLDHHHGAASPLSAAVCRARRIASGLGYGDGLLPRPEPDLEPPDDDAEVVRLLRGPNELKARIDWYRGAISRRAA